MFSPEESQGQRSLAGYSPWVHIESDTTEGTKQAGTHIYLPTFPLLSTPKLLLCTKYIFYFIFKEILFSTFVINTIKYNFNSQEI